MPKFIKHKKIHHDAWIHLLATEEIPAEGDLIVPLKLWKNKKTELLARQGKLGVRLEGEHEPSEIADDLRHLHVIAIHFSTFMDGRGYSLARILRDRYQYQGEIRAVGDVLRDQLFYMQRCGFDAFEVHPSVSTESALHAFDDFTISYQASTDNPLPLFRRVNLA